MGKTIDYTKLGLLPYQIDYIKDNSQVKLYVKSRQVGITRTQALEDVIDAGIEGLYNVWFSSNNDLNAKEYIRYCKQFAEAFHMTVKDLTSHDLITDSTVYSIEFHNQCRITAVSSSPEQLHGKSGKIILDEFARREHDFDTWEAASPAALIWGNPLRIISTQNGKKTLFFDFINKIMDGKLKWSLHQTTIENAVSQGLADKVLGRELSTQERHEWLNDLREQVASPMVWAQQFMCIPQEESEHFLPYTLLEANAKAHLSRLKDLKESGTLYAGIDIGRFKNLSVLWIVEQITQTHFSTRYIRVFEKTDFVQQFAIINSIIKELPKLRRICIDQTGMGIGLTDFLKHKHGSSLIEGITLTGKNKEVMAFRIQRLLQDYDFDIPNEQYIFDDLHSIKQDTTATGNIRLHAATNEDTGSHADYFWAAALALEAATSKPYVRPEAFTSGHIIQNFKSILKGFKRE